jgi:hypothetical protein
VLELLAATFIALPDELDPTLAFLVLSVLRVLVGRSDGVSSALLDVRLPNVLGDFCLSVDFAAEVGVTAIADVGVDTVADLVADFDELADLDVGGLIGFFGADAAAAATTT